ncbi:hypothetical protein [Streptomyces flavidovirens]|uniref:hypothetical protein n=1 Tax=Streptomyces flavidovirens TaxID=67298 RepID=UPI0036B7EC51
MTEIEPQGTHHFVLTTEKAQPDGTTAVFTWSGHLTPPAAATRYDVYVWLTAQHEARQPLIAGGHTTFFSLERNQL